MSEPLRVAVCVRCDNRGGVEVAAGRVLRLLEGRGYDVTVIGQGREDVIHELIPKSVRVVRPRIHGLAARFIGNYPIYVHLGAKTIRLRTGRLSSLARRMLRLFGDTRNLNVSYDYVVRHFAGLPETTFDVVLDFQGYGCVETAIAAAIPALRKATWVHDAEFGWMPESHPYLHRFDRIFCVSQSVKQVMDSRYPEFSTRTSVLYTPIDVKAIRKKALEQVASPRGIGVDFDGITIVTLARLSPEKNVALAIRTAAELHKMGVPFRWLVFGDGSRRSHLGRMIANARLEGCMTLCGSVDNPYPYVANADCYVQTSRSEGFGLAVQEARILGTPVVATDIPAFREQIRDGVTGFLCESDAKSIASAIARLQADPEMRHDMRRALQEENSGQTHWPDPFYAFLEGKDA
ncbi:glycosyltransferase [Bifidobacterium sp. CP2]|uniref:glycosyltransferase n=1 Tax=Bifidobacterium sp. CP2 TaxID=2809025 RepID=UPI001BDDA414|nr:glycosyltransferase [Bifidobacterium sp. CP2]MBT1182129.1 glycosyltransferase [Bifidobacterium sp. CP2]